jgi:glyoxylase-like metal-dependent hydrolase (beta-lactamase superfamily II)
MIHIIDLHFQGSADTIAAFLIETSEGPVLVETGPHATLPALERGIAALGYGLRDVRHVFLSHIHLDHAGAAWVFARMGAAIYVHPAGERHLLNPEKLYQSAKMIYQDEMEALWGDLQPIAPENIVVAGHGEAFQIGDATVQAWHTPGHAVHHIAWQSGDSLFTGDVGGVKIHRGMVAPPCPPPDIHVEDWQQSLALIRSLPVKRLYLTHYGPITDIENHLNELEERLLDWTAWMKPCFEAGESAELITPRFTSFVMEQLRQTELTEAEIIAYEKANPAWMSVAGLMRYWKKKSAAQ